MTQEDCNALIEHKKQKEKEKLLKVWEEEGIRIEKARWGRFNVIKGKIKVELPKGTDIEKISLDTAIALFKKKQTKKSKSKNIDYKIVEFKSLSSNPEIIFEKICIFFGYIILLATSIGGGAWVCVARDNLPSGQPSLSLPVHKQDEVYHVY